MTNRTTIKDIALGVAIVALAILSYELLNHVGRPKLIELTTDFDRSMPLVPVFVVPYLSFIPLVFVVLPLLSLRSAAVFRAYCLSLFIAQMIMNVLYLLVPATVVRPTLEGTDVFSVLLRDLVWKLDEPLNTFPSNHVTFSVIAILALTSLKLGRWWVLPLQIWLGLVCVSTLLVYQHVVLDLISGVGIGVLVFWLTSRAMSQAKAKM
jgi:membrane-associated phospholipid phosphatase